MTKLKKLTIKQTKQLTKYRLQKENDLLILGYCIWDTEEIESIINLPKPFAYLTNGYQQQTKS